MGWLSAGASILGDVMSSQGAGNANAANRAFAWQQQMESERFASQESDTAMQRRVTDLKAAGLNPLLAISQGGASTPTASGNAVSMQNTGAAFGNLGQQVSNAIQTDAQVKNQNAQADQAQASADLLRAQTPSPATESGTPEGGDWEVGDNRHKLGDANVANIQAQTGVSTAQARQVAANINYINAQTDQTKVQALLNGQDLDILKATKTALIQQETAKGAEAKNVENVQSGSLGRNLAIINSILQPISTAAGASHHIASTSLMNRIP